MLPTLCILLLTCPRPPERELYAEKTLRSTLRNLNYAGRLKVHIANDSEYFPTKLEIIACEELGYAPTVTTTGGELGYGANYNRATMIVHEEAEVILPLEDDWELTRSFDITRYADFLMRQDEIDCIRLGYIGYTQELRAKFVFDETMREHFLLLDPDSPEPHVWAGNPRLETRTRQRRVSLWPEDLDPGATEFAVTHRPNARTGVAWPADLMPPSGNLWAHIGAVQARKDQPKVTA